MRKGGIKFGLFIPFKSGRSRRKKGVKFGDVFGGNLSGNPPLARSKSTSLPKGQRKDVFGRSPGSSVPLTAGQKTVKTEGFEDVFGKSPKKKKVNSVRLAAIWKKK